MHLLLLLTACDVINNVDTAAPRDCEERQLFYVDADGDGFGVEDQKILACEQPADSSEVAGDCDDSDPNLVEDCAPAPLENCTGGLDQSLVTPTYPDANFPECPSPLTGHAITWEWLDARRYITIQQCTVQGVCAEGVLSAVELSCQTQVASAEDAEGAPVEITPEDTVTLVVISDTAHIDPGLQWPLEVGLLTAKDGSDRWLSIYDGDFALRFGWMESEGPLTPPADLMSKAGLDGVPWWGAMSVQDNLEICDWEDATQRTRATGLDLAIGGDTLTIGASSWGDLGDDYRVNTGLLQDSLDSGSFRSLLITGR